MHWVDNLIDVDKNFAETMLDQIFFRHYFTVNKYLKWSQSKRQILIFECSFVRICYLTSF